MEVVWILLLYLPFAYFMGKLLDRLLTIWLDRETNIIGKGKKQPATHDKTPAFAKPKFGIVSLARRWPSTDHY